MFFLPLFNLRQKIKFQTKKISFILFLKKIHYQAY